VKPIIFSLCLAVSTVVFSPTAWANPLEPQAFQAVLDANPIGMGHLEHRSTLELSPSPSLAPMVAEPLGEGHQTAMVIIAAGGLLLSAIALFASMK